MRYSMTPRRRPMIATRPLLLLALTLLGVSPRVARAQAPVTTDTIIKISLSIGRSVPLSTTDPIIKVAVAAG